jgi:hypothetical protein
MVRRFIRDESGIALGLAVIMIVLIGVMGAGLLVFVRNDLEAVVEVNQGQRALERANVGVEAAKKQLATEDARPENYNTDPLDGDSEWSEITGAAGGTGDGEKRLDFDGDGQIDVFVEIRYLKPTPDDQPDKATKPDYAPEVLPAGAVDGPDEGTYPDYPNSANFFRVTVRGESGNAVRKVQAIYRTQNFKIPVAFFATRDINFNGNATTVDGLSLFARRCITNLRPSNITGPDRTYGDWYTDPVSGIHEADNPNNVPRTNADGSTNDRAGAAALGVGASDPACGGDASGITYDPTSTNNSQKNGTANPQRYGYRDVDRGSILADKLNTKDFSTSNSTSRTVTFPFETGNLTEDNETIAALKQKAQDEGKYIQFSNGESFNIDDGTGATNYPRNSELETVMFIEFTGSKGSVTYRADTSSADNFVKGTIVVVNGDLSTSSSADDFQGAFIVRDGDSTQIGGAEPVMTYNNGGSINVRGFINVEGDINLRGNVDGLLSGELVNGIPGLYSLSRWSWRECYSLNCS